MDSGAAAAVFMMSARLGLVSEMNFYNFFFFQPPAPRELVFAEQAPINWVFLYLYFHLYLDWYQIMACQQKYVFKASSFSNRLLASKLVHAIQALLINCVSQCVRATAKRDTTRSIPTLSENIDGWRRLLISNV